MGFVLLMCRDVGLLWVQQGSSSSVAVGVVQLCCCSTAIFGCFTACGEWNVDGERLWVWLMCTHQRACGMLCSCTTVFTGIHHDVLLEAAAKRFVSQHTVLRYGTAGYGTADGTADGTAEHNMNMVVGMCSARVL
jgi:hypothetical protein